MNALRTATALLLLALTTTACSIPGLSSKKKGPNRSAEPVSVRVTNHNWMDVTVYALRAGSSYRLGNVTSMRASRFRLPSALGAYTGDLRLMADPIGSRDSFVTPSIQVSPGQTIDFTVENHLEISSVAVWGS